MNKEELREMPVVTVEQISDFRIEAFAYIGDLESQLSELKARNKRLRNELNQATSQLYRTELEEWEELKAENEALKQGWISVEDRLPEDGQVCFVYCKESDRLEYVPFVGQWPLVIINWETGESTCPITHWMPLPTPPSEGE